MTCQTNLCFEVQEDLAITEAPEVSMLCLAIFLFAPFPWSKTKWWDEVVLILKGMITLPTNLLCLQISNDAVFLNRLYCTSYDAVFLNRLLKSLKGIKQLAKSFTMIFRYEFLLSWSWLIPKANEQSSLVLGWKISWKSQVELDRVFILFTVKKNFFSQFSKIEFAI